MSPAQIRPLDRERDLTALLALVGRSRAGADTGAIFHPGGLQWWLRRLGQTGFEVAVLIDDGLVGFVLRDGSDVLVQTDIAHAGERQHLLAWTESRVRETGEAEMFVSVFEDDDGLRGTVLARGYEATER